MDSISDNTANTADAETAADMTAAAAAPETTAAASQPERQPQRRGLPTWVYKLLLLSATLMWGFSFFVMKNAVDAIPPAFLLGFRFFICGILMTLIFWRRMRTHFNRDHILRGCIAGTLMIVAYLFQTYGLMDTTPGKNAFLTATYCIIVPFVWWVVARRRPTIFNILAAVGCVVGIGLVSMSAADLSNGTLMSRGDALTLVCAFFFGLHMVYVAKVAPGRDVYVITAWQFLAAGALSFVLSAATEPSPANIAITGQLIMEVAYLTIFASLLALLIQNVALTRVAPAPAALIISLESVFGVIFSVIFYGEQLNARLMVGFALIFIAILVSELGSDLRKRLQAKAREGAATDTEGDDRG